MIFGFSAIIKMPENSQPESLKQYFALIMDSLAASVVEYASKRARALLKRESKLQKFNNDGEPIKDETTDNPKSHIITEIAGLAERQSSESDSDSEDSDSSYSEEYDFFGGDSNLYESQINKIDAIKTCQ